MVVASQSPFLRSWMAPGTPKTKFAPVASNVTTHSFAGGVGVANSQDVSRRLPVLKSRMRYVALAGALVSVKVVVPLGSVVSQSPLRRMIWPSTFQSRVTVDVAVRTAVQTLAGGSGVGSGSGVGMENSHDVSTRMPAGKSRMM